MDDPQHRSSARDLAKLTATAMDCRMFRRIVATITTTITTPNRIIPPLLLWGVVGQFRAGTTIRSSKAPLPRWVHLIYASIALVTGLVGVGLFVVPATVAPIWFWPLTPLLARMTAAWLIGVCSAAALVLLDNHVGRSRITALTLIAYAVLQFVVLARYAHVVNWTMLMAWIWVVVLALTVIVNVWVVRHSEPSEA